MSAQVDVNAILEACEAYVDDAASFPEHFKPGLVKRHQSQYRKARAAVAALIAERDALVQEVERLRWDCAEAYQVVGAGMLGEPCSYTQADVERALDNLSAAANDEPRPHDDLLPWPRATALALALAQGVQS